MTPRTSPPPWPALHYTQVGVLGPARTWGLPPDVFRREVGRLLDEGREGQYVLILGDRILCRCATLDDAQSEWLRRRPTTDGLIRVEPIQEWHRVGRYAPPVCLCHDTSSPLPRTA